MKQERKIYFAGAIRGGRDDAPIYAEIVRLLGEHGEVLTEHIGDEALTSAGETILSDLEIYERDLEWLRGADVLVAEVTTPSLGVGYEIAKMTEWRRPVLCLFRPAKRVTLSALIAADSGVEILRYESASELPAAFRQFFDSH